MDLIDFKVDESLNNLRSKMGAHELGHFELFDPDRHASWQEKRMLSKELLKASGHHLKEQHNQLYYKNVKVIAEYDNAIHFGYCDVLKRVSAKGQLMQLSITSQFQALNVHMPCQYCLHHLDYQGFDVYRQRHQAHNEKILQEFDLSGYLKQYFSR